MQDPTNLLDEILKTLTPKPDSPISESFKCYNNALKLLETELQSEYKKGYDQCKKDVARKTANHQIKNN